ncbi:MAG: beta-eliminating lyase-related protein [Bacillota bacterium]|nr:beta-eliminating lyase-related protein [Bacillota bacterium]
MAGPARTIALARRKRKILGGGMRQIGILAAAGLLALREQRQLLPQDHLKAQWLSEQLACYPQWFSLVRQPQINLVFFRLTGYPVDRDRLADLLAAQNILINGPDEGIFRFVTHYWTDQQDLERVMAALVALAVG